MAKSSNVFHAKSAKGYHEYLRDHPQELCILDERRRIVGFRVGYSDGELAQLLESHPTWRLSSMAI